MTIAIYPGSFDPIHYGHIEIVRRASLIFEQVIWAAYDRPLKNVLFNEQERLDFMREAALDLPKVTVQSYHGLTVLFARQVGAKAIVRGLRATHDFEIEYQMALTNAQQASEIETVCLMTGAQYAFLSSSILKEVALANGDISSMVPPYVASRLQTRIAQLGEDRGEKVKLVSLQE